MVSYVEHYLISLHSARICAKYPWQNDTTPLDEPQVREVVVCRALLEVGEPKQPTSSSSLKPLPVWSTSDEVHRQHLRVSHRPRHVLVRHTVAPLVATWSMGSMQDRGRRSPKQMELDLVTSGRGEGEAVGRVFRSPSKIEQVRGQRRCYTEHSCVPVTEKWQYRVQAQAETVRYNVDLSRNETCA